MIEIGIADQVLRRYLIATRGEGSEYLRYPTDRLSRFFADGLETFDALGDTTHIKLIYTNSYRGDIEHIHFGKASYIIFDQSMMELLGIATDALLRSMSLALDGEDLSRPGILNAFYASRQLALGRPLDAAFHASLCQQSRRREPRPYKPDRQRRDAWVEIQSCFIIGHEVMHSRLLPRDSRQSVADESILASRIANDFASRMRPLLQAMDKESSEAKRGDSWNSEWRAVPGTEDDSPPEFEGRDLSWEEQLRWITETQSGFGQKVLCDYGGALLAARNRGGKFMSADECLVACYTALVIRVCMQIIERRILAFTPRVPERIEDTLKVTEESRARIVFLRLALRALCRNGAYKDMLGKGSSEEDARKRASSQWEIVNDFLERIDRHWTWPLVELSAGGNPIDGVKGEKIPEDLDVNDLRQVSSYVRSSIGVTLDL